MLLIVLFSFFFLCDLMLYWWFLLFVLWFNWYCIVVVGLGLFAGLFVSVDCLGFVGCGWGGLGWL